MVIYRSLERVIIAICAAAFGIVVLVASLLAHHADHSERETPTGIAASNQVAVGEVMTSISANI